MKTVFITGGQICYISTTYTKPITRNMMYYHQLWKPITHVFTVVFVLTFHTATSENADFTYRLPYEMGLWELSDKPSISRMMNVKKEMEILSSPEVLLSQLASLNWTSELCSKQINYTFEHLQLSLTPNFANKMLDATGKLNPGLLIGRVKVLGDFDECVSISSNWTSSLDKDYKFDAHQCLVTLPDIKGTNAFVGLCLPAGCSATDLKNLFRYFDLTFNSSLFHKAGASCQDKEADLSNGAIVTIVMYSIMAAVCVVATAYDGWLNFLESYKTSTNRPSVKDDELPLVQESTGTARKHGVLTRLILCFSLYTNGYKMLNSDKTADSLGCLHGIRFLSMTWVILGHSVSLFLTSITSNIMTPLNWVKNRWSLEVILNATVSVDSFFVMSGLLSVYMMLKQFEKNQPSVKQFFKSVPIMYLHRYIRLTPAYIFMIIFWTNIPYYLVTGPFKPPTPIIDENCVHNWWSNLLYINNVYQTNNQCAAWSWYLANDFQFFLFTPFIAYLTIRKEVLGVSLNVLLVVISIVCAMVVDFHFDFGITPFGNEIRDPTHPKHPAGKYYMQYYYMVPHTRYQSFGIGCLVGYLMWKLKRKLAIHWAINLLLIGASGAIMLAYLYGPFSANAKTHQTTLTEAIFYNGIGRTGWSLALGYIILICCCGRGGFIDEILSWPGFIPLSRMTYSAYLIHIVVLVALNYNLQSAFYLTDFTLVTSYLAVLVYAYIAAFLFSLLFEAPFMNLDKNFLTGVLMKKQK